MVIAVPIRQDDDASKQQNGNHRRHDSLHRFLEADGRQQGNGSHGYSQGDETLVVVHEIHVRKTCQECVTGVNVAKYKMSV